MSIEPVTQASILLAIFALFALLQNYCQPYSHHHSSSDVLNRMEFVSLMGLIIVLTFGIMLHYGYESTANSSVHSTADVATVLLIVSIAVLLLVFLIEIIRHPRPSAAAPRDTVNVIHGASGRIHIQGGTAIYPAETALCTD